jgi:DNA repair photolyase
VCSYCYARNSHEYLGFSAGLDFESKIMVKDNAPELLRSEVVQHFARLIRGFLTTSSVSLFIERPWINHFPSPSAG